MRLRCLTRYSIGAFLLLSAVQSRAQLAITEVHSNAGTNGTPAIHADWWELTNYGAQPVDLTGYRFNDATGGLATGSVTLPQLVLAAGESLILVEAIEPSAFRQWWGEGLSPSVQVYSYATNGIGLSSSGDSIRLWPPGTEDESATVDQVDFGSAGADSATFVYDAATGLMTGRSVVGLSGAFAAADNGDVGSPGIAPAPAALEILTQPSSVVVNPGDSTTLSVGFRGLPRPRIQWYREGVLLAGATRSQLLLTNIGPSGVGRYRATLDNGLGMLTSTEAVVSLAEVPQAPVLTLGLTNQTALAGATVTFVAQASGVPQPSYSWRFNGTLLEGESGATLILAGVTTNQAGTYEVRAANASGTVTSSAVLQVATKPDIRITEVRSTDALDPDFSRRNGFSPQDWVEITSFERAPVSLLGWRLDDNSASLTAAYTFTNDIVILPGESVILVERLTPEQFRVWWGTNELPAGLKVLTYGGSGFGLSSGGDGVRLWNATALTASDTVASVDFPAGSPGVTFGYDPESGTFGGLSVEGVNGVYQAPGSIDMDLGVTVKDIGSPGRIRAGAVVLPPNPPTLSASIVAGKLLVRFLGESGRQYRLERKATADATEWTTVTDMAGVAGEMELDAGSADAAMGLYRVVIP